MRATRARSDFSGRTAAVITLRATAKMTDVLRLAYLGVDGTSGTRKVTAVITLDAIDDLKLDEGQ
jgi:hypothetical protein